MCKGRLMRISRRKIRQIILESMLQESKQTRKWIKTQPLSDQDALLQAYNDGIKDLSQLAWIQKTRGTEPIPDVAADVIRFFDPQVQTIVKENGFPTDLNKRNYPTVNELRRVISQVEALIDSRKKKSVPTIKPIDDPNQVEKLAQVGPWTILLPKTVTGSTACDISGEDTSWCTTKTRGQNLFLTYVGREDGDVILFYVMDYSRTPDDPYQYQDKPFLKNNDSRISIGFVHGKPVLRGENGSLSVDAANMGLTDDDLRSEKGLGQYYDQIMGIIKAEAAVIGSNHPAKESLKRACQDLLYLKSVIKDYEEDAKKDYLEQVMNSKYDKSPEVMQFTAYYTPDYLLQYIQTDFYRVGETMTPESVKEAFNKIMTMSPKDIFKYPSTRYGLGDPKKAIITSLLKYKSHLMDNNLFAKCLEEHAFGEHGYRDPRSINMALDLLIEDIRRSLTFIAPPHPLIQQKMDEQDRKMLSDEGMKNAIKQSSYKTRGYNNGGLEAVSETYFNSKDKELKTNFFAENIEHRFNYFLSCVRYLLENGNSTRKYNEDGSFTRLNRPEMTQMDGLAMGMTVSILDAVTRENQQANADVTEMLRAPKLVIQEIENAIYENFPEFFQMSKSEFTSFMRDGEHDVDSRFYDYAGNMSIKRFAFNLFHSSGSFTNNDGRYQIKTSRFCNLFSAIAGSPHISERAANHFKKHINDYYKYFLSNPVHCDDQFLIDLYKSRDAEYQTIQRYRADGTTEDVRRLKPDSIKNSVEIEIINRVNYKKTWTLGREVLDELGIVDEGYMQ
tara:strand:- start:87 stop:2441 length:2355 start_codon:yes stop_codon:yes gene_type:complete